MEKLGIDKSDLQNVEVPADIMAGIMKILACEEPQEVPEAKPPVSQPPKEPAPVIDVDKQLFPDLKQVYGADGAPDAAAGEEHDVPAEASEEGYSSLLGDGGDEWGDFCEPEAAELEGEEPEGWADGEWQQCEEATPIETEQWQQCEQDLQWPAPAEASSVLESEQWQDETTVKVSAANCASGCTSVQYEIGSANEWSIVADLATCLITNLLPHAGRANDAFSMDCTNGRRYKPNPNVLSGCKNEDCCAEHKAKILGAMKGFDPDIIRIQRRKAKEKRLKEKAKEKK